MNHHTLAGTDALELTDKAILALYEDEVETSYKAARRPGSAKITNEDDETDPPPPPPPPPQTIMSTDVQ